MDCWGVSWFPALTPPFLPSFLPSLNLIYSKTPRLVKIDVGSRTRGDAYTAPTNIVPRVLQGDPPGRFRFLFFPESPQVSWFHDEITGPWVVAAVMKLEDLMPSDPLLLLKSHSAHQHTIPRLVRHLRTSDAYALPSLKSFSRTFMPNNSPASSFYLILHSGR